MWTLYNTRRVESQHFKLIATFSFQIECAWVETKQWKTYYCPYAFWLLCISILAFPIYRSYCTPTKGFFSLNCLSGGFFPFSLCAQFLESSGWLLMWDCKLHWDTVCDTMAQLQGSRQVFFPQEALMHPTKNFMSTRPNLELQLNLTSDAQHIHTFFHPSFAIHQFFSNKDIYRNSNVLCLCTLSKYIELSIKQSLLCLILTLKILMSHRWLTQQFLSILIFLLYVDSFCLSFPSLLVWVGRCLQVFFSHKRHTGAEADEEKKQTTFTIWLAQWLFYKLTS